MHSDLSTKVKNISLSIFLNFLSGSEKLYAVQCQATGRRDHGRIEPRWFSIRHTESILIGESDSNRLFPGLRRLLEAFNSTHKQTMTVTL